MKDYLPIIIIIIIIIIVSYLFPIHPCRAALRKVYLLRRNMFQPKLNL